jgi:RNA polymerase sigma factor (sigma-70 family)
MPAASRQAGDGRGGGASENPSPMTALALDPPRLPAVAAPELCSDETLARRAGAGDDAAYAAIYARYHGRLEAYCRAIVRHDEDARDAAQTAMTRALVAMRDERGAAHLRPWLFRIAHNEALTVLRRRRHHHELTEALEGRDADPAIAVLVREELRGMLGALAALPATHREALLLREVGGLDYGTVAAVVGMTPQAARQAVFRARAVVRAERLAGDQSQCIEIRDVLAGHDGRRRRARRVRAHLRACSACREWDAARPNGRALSAVPTALASAASTLWSWIGGAAAGTPGSIGGAAAAKVVTGVAVIAAGTAPIGQHEIVHRHAPAPAAQRQPAAARRPTAATRPAAAAPAAKTARQPPRRSLGARPAAVAPRATPVTSRPARLADRTTAPDRHRTALPAPSTSHGAARAGAPRGRDGAPGGRGPGTDDSVPSKR